eukprot:SAG31_NODE_5663_length_2396_cov_8.465331_2_plen_253_part_01
MQGDDLCEAFYEGDGKWYLAQVESADARGCSVLFVDYGNRERVSHDQVRLIGGWQGLKKKQQNKPQKKNDARPRRRHGRQTEELPAWAYPGAAVQMVQRPDRMGCVIRALPSSHGLGRLEIEVYRPRWRSTAPVYRPFTSYQSLSVPLMETDGERMQLPLGQLQPVQKRKIIERGPWSTQAGQRDHHFCRAANQFLLDGPSVGPKAAETLVRLAFEETVCYGKTVQSGKHDGQRTFASGGRLSGGQPQVVLTR